MTIFQTTTIFFSEPGDEFFGGQRPDLLLLRGDRVEQVGQTRQKRLLAPLVLRAVLQNLPGNNNLLQPGACTIKLNLKLFKEK